ncbi:restriction endonuclease subunit S [Nitrosomonas sp.]|uniref:restriction endonuclease subunit S n=1 Tax=Nitrosomonas sp. TaxID=42353 RepID=UPI00271A1320|nr:restriction endonuclease subunit S [Nitrosomonas sp.]MDO8895405.1 restriction endonuclease subunit S [Nitrosomonas sp.]
MSFPRYESYKESGVEWLGDVPEHWELKRLKRNLRLLTEKTDRRENPVALENIESWSGSFIQTETKFEGDGIAFERGDILFGKLRPYLAKVYLADASGEAVGDFHVMRPTKGVDSRFSQYQILNREFIAIVDGSTFGAKMPRVSWDFLGNMVLTTPPIPEQQTIAAFLDRETAKIDALIAEQQRLIELLKEKHQSVISYAVTKGLNPNAPMKDSGIEWLGEVPEHWGVVPLRWFASCASGNGISIEQVETEADTKQLVPVIGGNGVMGYTNLVNVKHSILAVGRVGALCGNVHIVNPPAWVTDNALILDAAPNAFDLTYLASVLRSRNLNDIASKTAQPLITGTQVRDQRVPQPPLEEQSAIVNFLERETAKLDALTTEAKTAITLLQERRTALISATVTGKIDVRGLVSAKTEVKVGSVPC